MNCYGKISCQNPFDGKTIKCTVRFADCITQQPVLELEFLPGQRLFSSALLGVISDQLRALVFQPEASASVPSHSSPSPHLCPGA
jgi:hypothetical protein